MMAPPEVLPIRCYDNGGPDVEDGTIDRYTVVFIEPFMAAGRVCFSYLATNCAPFHPQGVGMHGESEGAPIDLPDYSHLGKRIPFSALPPDCQKLVRQDLAGTITEKGAA